MKYYEIYVDYTRREIHYVKAANDDEAIAKLHDNTCIHTIDFDDCTDIHIEDDTITAEQYEIHMGAEEDD